MDALIQNIRYALRTMARNPGFTVIAVSALALGIGANTAIFSVVDAVLLRPLPYKHPDRLVTIWERSPKLEGMSVAYLNFIDWRAQSRTFEYMCAAQPESFSLTGVETPERIKGLNVSADMFPLLGVAPVIGRGFTHEEDRPGSRVIVISHSLWERRFNKSPAALGRTMILNSEPYTVVGVMPAGFRFPIDAVRGEIWAPLGRNADRLQERGSHPGIYAFARLKPGTSIEQARADMDAIAANLRRQYPDSNAENSAGMDFYHTRVVQSIRMSMLVLLGAVGFVLLIACANVANLLLARSAARSQEIAVRTSLGAGRGHIVRQLMTESLILGLTGGLAGLLIGYWGVAGLVAILPEGTPRLADIAIDARVIVFTLLISLATGLLFGMAPAFQAARRSLSDAMRESGSRTTGDRKRHRLLGGLIVAEVALSLVLLAGAGLMIRGFQRLTAASPGIVTANVLSAQIGLRGERYEDPSSLVRFQQAVLDRIRGLPGVRSAAAVIPLPLGGSGWQTFVYLEGMPQEPRYSILADVARVSPDYFGTMGQPILRGRAFTKADKEGSPLVAIIDESFARAHFNNVDPIGRKIVRQKEQLEIVGISAHVKNYGVQEESRIELFLPYAQSPNGSMYFVLKTEGDPLLLTGGLRAAVAEVDREQPLFNVASMDEVFAATISGRRVASLLLMVFAVLALVLAAVGIYGVVSYSVTQSTHEIGIRMALGAARTDVLRLVVRKTLVLIAAGLTIGIVFSLGLTRLLESMLYGISSTDLTTFLAVSLLLLAVALTATLIPARRATRVDPMIALRYE